MLDRERWQRWYSVLELVLHGMVGCVGGIIGAGIGYNRAGIVGAIALGFVGFCLGLLGARELPSFLSSLT